MQLKDRYSPYVDFVDDANVGSVRKVGEGGVEGFIVEDDTGRSWKGRKVILATGSRDVFPDIRGYADVWGNGM